VRTPPVTLRLAAADPGALETLAAALAAHAGRSVRLLLRVGDQTRELRGRVPRASEPGAGGACLVLRPGETDGVHVLAEMLAAVRRRQGRWLLARRRWYEDTDLDETPLGEGALEVTLLPL